MAKNNTQIKLPRIVFWFAVGMVFCVFVNAAAIEVVQVEPAKVRLSIPPGSSRTGTLKVYNYSKEPKYIKTYLEDWVYLPVCDGTKDFKPAGTTELSSAGWISFSPADFTIAAYGLQVINYAVKVPPEAKGGHYAILFFENTTGKQISMEGVGVAVNVRVGVLFYIEPAGTIDRSSKVDNFKLSEKEGVFYIEADFSNTGNVDMTSKGSFHIMDERGIVRVRGEFDDLYTFPGNRAKLKSFWKEALPAGKYNLVMSINTGKAVEEAGMGRGIVITREAELVTGDGGKIISAGDLK